MIEVSASSFAYPSSAKNALWFMVFASKLDLLDVAKSRGVQSRHILIGEGGKQKSHESESEP